MGNLIKKWSIVPIMGLIWLLALLYQSGIGMVYDVYGKTKLLVIVLTLYHVFLSQAFRRISKKTLVLIVSIIVFSFITEVIYGHEITDYIWLYLLIPLIALLPIEEAPMRMVSIMYGVLGMAVLFVRNYMTAFNGWNTNSLAMVAFFSFAVMIASFNNTRNPWQLLWMAAYFVVYYLWSEPLNSRGGVLFSLLMLLCILEVLPIKKWLQNRWFTLIVLLLPLLIAILIVLIRNTPLVEALDVWSKITFQKPLFNGRDEIWAYGFKQWFNHPFFGNGDLSAYNWHNSAVTMLVGCGAIGYMIWISGILNFYKKAAGYFQDKIIWGLAIGFLSIWLQQTIELGLVAGKANAIPYAMLGLILGRINTLNARKPTLQ